jgi:hypothetical protein
MAAVFLLFAQDVLVDETARSLVWSWGLLQVRKRRQQCYVERVTMGEGIRSKSCRYDLLLAGAARRSAIRPRSKQRRVCVQLECREVGSVLNSWCMDGREVSVPEDTFGVERLCDNECEGCRRPQDVYCWKLNGCREEKVKDSRLGVLACCQRDG